MAFDITNPATYTEDFKSLLRQKGYAGKKDVPVEELEALYVDYSGKQEQDTKVATNLLSSVAADPAPYTGAMTNQDTFQGDQSFDLTQMNTQGGSGPIFSTVQAVDEQEALKRQQMEQSAAQPDPNDEFRMVAQERLLPVIDAIKQKRSALSGIDNTFKRRMEEGAVDQLASTRINDLARDGVISTQDAEMIRKRADESKGLTYEESLRGFLIERMNPAAKQDAVVSGADANELLKTATQTFDSAVRFFEASPEDPSAKAAVDSAGKAVQAAQKRAGLSTEPDLIAGYSKTLGTIETLMNAQKERIPALKINGQTVTQDKYDDMITGLQADLGTYHASPEFRASRPKIVKEGKTEEEFEAAVREANGIYLDEEGRLVTPKLFEEQQKGSSFRRFRPKDAVVIPATQTEDAPALAAGEKNMIRRMITEGEDLTKTRFSPEVVASVQAEMDDEQVERALRKLYAGNSWASMVGLRNPNIKDQDMSGVLGRTNDPQAAKFLSEVDPEIVTRVYEKTGRLQGPNAAGFKNSDGTWSRKVDPPEEVLFRIRQLASTRGK